MRAIAVKGGPADRRVGTKELAELEQQGRIRKVGKKYQVTSKFLELWLRQSG
jgi:hypothetical protein